MAKNTNPAPPFSLLASEVPSDNAGTGLELLVNGGASFRVLSAHKLGDRGVVWGLARGVNTRALVRFVAAAAPASSTFRAVSVVAAVDTGDAAGTLVFPAARPWTGRVLNGALGELVR